jgi:hypothetical protein
MLEMRMLRKWLVLSFAGLLCITVWGMVFGLVFKIDKSQYAQEYESTNQVMKDSTTGLKETLTMPIMEKPMITKLSFKERGISKGDVIHIAPNGEISIDDLLIIVTQADQY